MAVGILLSLEPVLYGETLFIDAIAGQLDVVVLEPSHDGLPKLPDRYRRRRVELISLGEARARSGPQFVKAPDEKLLRAAVYCEDLETVTRTLPDETPILVAEPVR